jgi:hypothetical protein
MVVHDFDFFRSVVCPPEAQTKLIIYPYAVLPRPIAFERFQSVAGRNAQVVQSACDLELSELTSCHSRDVHETRDTLALG